MSKIVGLGTAAPGDVRSSKTATSGSGLGFAGTLADNGNGPTITPSPNAQTLAAGIYNSLITVQAVTFDATKLLTGTTVAGTAGTMPNQGAPTWTPGAAAITLTAGYYSGGTIQGVSFDTTKVLTGTVIAGTPGTMPNQGSPTLQPGSSIPAGYYSGGSVANGSVGFATTTASATNTFSLSLPWTPSIIVASWVANGNNYMAVYANGNGVLNEAAYSANSSLQYSNGTNPWTINGGSVSFYIAPGATFLPSGTQITYWAAK